MKYLGRLPRRYHRDTLRLHDYSPLLGGQLPPAPATATWGAQAEAKFPTPGNWGMMLNDSEGDCVYAAGGHSIMGWTSNANTVYVPPDADIQTGYESTGFVPGNPATDNGTVITQMLQYWRDTGLSGHKIVGWAEFEPSNPDDVKFVIANFGLAFVGCQIRQADMNNFDSGNVWTPDNGPVLGGHGVILTDYDDSTVSIVTWGKRIQSTWDWIKQNVDEAYAPLTADWINQQKQSSPSGLTIGQLQMDLGYFG